MTRPSFASLAAAGGLVLVVSCTSGTTSTTGDGGSVTGGDGGLGPADGPRATPRVIFQSDIAPGAGGATACGQSGAFFTIGSFSPAAPVEDGAADQGGSVAVSCSVAASAAGFNVTATAQLTGASGGAVTITGIFDANGPSSGVAMSVTRKGETFSDTRCTARYDAAVGQAIAAGRVWATIECANAERPSAQQTCTTRAQMRFENCSQ